MNLTYKYLVQPTRAQHAALAEILESQRQLYNAALEERIGCYRATGRTQGYVDQCRALTVCRHDIPEMGAMPLAIQRWTIRRLDEAYAAFFRRVRHGGAPGFPRFRGRGRWDSFGFLDKRSLHFDGHRFRWPGLPGGLRVHLHRPFSSAANIRACVFRRQSDRWFACIVVEIEAPEKAAAAHAVGIDLGLSVFAYQSDSVIIPTPRIGRRSGKELRQRQRALARCKRCSCRRQKVRNRVARTHRKITNARRTWLHQHSARLVRSYDLIAAEDLNVSGMVRNRSLARSISDAGWSTFLAMVAYKAERAGKHFVTVDPRNTSQRCSGCGELVPKSLAVRTHSCPHCGLVIDRDWNAARNIIQAVAGLGQPNVAYRGERAAGNMRPINADATEKENEGG